jgi:hypothetical protein
MPDMQQALLSTKWPENPYVFKIQEKSLTGADMKDVENASV